MSSYSYRILFVQEGSAISQTVRGLLENAPDFSVQLHSAASLEAALPMLVSGGFDALLLDIAVLDSRGLDELSELCTQFSWLPVVALVSHDALGKQAIDSGAAEYLVKEALSRELLLRTVRYAIERRRAEHAARKYELRLAEFFESAKDILFTLDLEGNITSLNKSAEEVMGWSRSEALQKNIKNFVAPEYLNVCNQMMQRIVNEEPLQHFEIGMLGIDGRKVLLEASARLIYTDGKKVGVHGIARDVTERRHLENTVRHSQKLEAIGRLSGGLAHDFNNLLCVISGHTEILSERLELSDIASKSITQIKKAADSAAALTRQLLAFSRKQVFHPRTLDLNSIVLETEKLLGRLIGEHIEFYTALDPALGHVRVDPVQLEQVLVNLVLNARDAMPQGGKLSIETSDIDLEDKHQSRYSTIPAGKYVLLAVTDTGCGMDEETQSRIFEPFYTTKELGKGTGLGLATVYGIVKQSGGFIWVYNEPGQGTTFKVYLPRVDNPLTATRPAKRRLDLRKGVETILLVEDAEPLRALVKDFLKDSGYTVLEAENGDDAIRIAGAFGGPIHLLLTDVIMPNMGGKQLVEQMTSLRPATKVLFMSGYPNDSIVQSGILANGVLFIEKPFARETLLRKIRQVLEELPEAT